MPQRHQGFRPNASGHKLSDGRDVSVTRTPPRTEALPRLHLPARSSPCSGPGALGFALKHLAPRLDAVCSVSVWAGFRRHSVRRGNKTTAADRFSAQLQRQPRRSAQGTPPLRALTLVLDVLLRDGSGVTQHPLRSSVY